MHDPRSRPPTNVVAAIGAFDGAGVRWIAAGHCADLRAGTALVSDHLEVVPAVDAANLESLAGVLDALHATRARPHFVLPWQRRRYLRWAPWPATTENLDALVVTAAGLIDVVPYRFGSYHALLPTAIQVSVGGYRIRVASSSGEDG